MSNTPNLDLTLTPEYPGSQTFKEWRSVINGETASNMWKIDSAFGEMKSRIGFYTGENLVSRFSNEISGGAYGGDPWMWIQSRIQSGNYDGILIGDYIQFSAGGNTYNAQVAGINTYTRSGATPIKNHIDFISAQAWPEEVQMNTTDVNEGTATSGANGSPWLVSELYKWLNSTGDYASGGVYYNLPASLKRVITNKYAAMEVRYETTRTYRWGNIGNLWLPTEMEVYGAAIHSEGGYACVAATQYPLFSSSNQARRKVVAGTSSTSATWWLMTPAANEGMWCAVNYSTSAQKYLATETYRVPICFRIAQT